MSSSLASHGRCEEDVHVEFGPSVLDFRTGARTDEEVELLLGRGVGLEVVLLDVVRDGLRNEIV